MTPSHKFNIYARDSQDRFSHNTAGRYDNNGASRGFQNNGRFERSNNDRTEGEWRRKSSKDEQDEQGWCPCVCAGVLDSSELNIKFHSRR